MRGNPPFLNPKTRPSVSIIIAHLNSIQYIDQLFDSLLRTTYDNYEIVFIDDGSTDGGFERAREHLSLYPRSIVIRNPERKGTAASRNLGIAKSSGEILIFVEADMAFESNWLEELVECIMSDHLAGGGQPIVLDLTDRQKIQAYSTIIIPHLGWYVNIGLGRAFSHFGYPSDVTFGFGAGLAVRRTILEKIGTFDESIEHNLSDTDLCWRLWLSGHRLIVARRSIVYHQTMKSDSSRLNYISHQRWEFDFGKSLRIMMKNLDRGNLFRYLPTAVLAMFARAMLSLSRGQYRRTFGIFHSLAWNLFMFGDTYHERRYVQKNVRRVPDYSLRQVIMYENFYSAIKSYREYKRSVASMRSSLLKMP